MKRSIFLAMGVAMLFVRLCWAGDVTVTLVGIDPMTINIKGNSQPEEAGNISIYLYYRDDGTTDLTVGNVDGSQLVTNWGWGSTFEDISITPGSYSKGGHTFASVLQYDHVDLADQDDYWTTGGINAVVVDFTAVGSGHAYIETTDANGLADYLGVGHNVTYANQDVSLPVEMNRIYAEVDQKEGVIITWRTESEVNSAGFHVWKSEEESGDYIKISQDLIPSQGGSSSSAHEYTFQDRDVRSGIIYWYKIQELSTTGETEFYGPISVMGVDAVPVEFALSDNYPNPFNPDTEFNYQLPENSDVQITVYSLLGRKIRDIVMENQKAGYYTARWNGTNQAGQQVASGIYLLVMQAGTFSSMQKMTIIR